MITLIHPGGIAGRPAPAAASPPARRGEVTRAGPTQPVCLEADGPLRRPASLARIAGGRRMMGPHPLGLATAAPSP